MTALRGSGWAAAQEADAAKRKAMYEELQNQVHSALATRWCGD
jgi:hypothetical protein